MRRRNPLHHFIASLNAKENHMGNRAVIAFGTKPSSIGIYLHWNGGPEKVTAFLDAAKQLGVRPDDANYQAARLCQIIGNFMKGSALSLGVGTVKTLDYDNGDNGTYYVDGALNIVSRKYTRASAASQQFDQKDYNATLKAVLEINAPIFAAGA